MDSAPVPQGSDLTIGLWSSPPLRRNRGTALIRILMVIPQYVVLFFVGIAALVIVIVGWFAALVTGRLPDFVHQFLSGVLRWELRVAAYLWLLTDEYPPFSLEPMTSYPVQLEIPAPVELNRLAVLFRIILAIPAAIVASVLWTGLGVVSIVSWATIVFTGTMPEPIYEAGRAAVRYHGRYLGYLWMLTSEYPWGVYGDATTAATPEVPEGLADQVGDGRWLVLTSSGRTTISVMLVIGVILDAFNYGRLY